MYGYPFLPTIPVCNRTINLKRKLKVFPCIPSDWDLEMASANSIVKRATGVFKDLKQLKHSRFTEPSYLPNISSCMEIPWISVLCTEKVTLGFNFFKGDKRTPVIFTRLRIQNDEVQVQEIR
jgi:hypothetical protein